MRLAIIVSHPIQYYSPWFRHIAQAMRQEATSRRSDDGDQKPEAGRPDPPPATSNPQENALRVFYLWDFGVTEKTDKGFGTSVKWDVDLLANYDYEFVPNVSKRPGTDWFGGLDNPELLARVRAFGPNVVLQFGYNYKALVGFDLRWDTRWAPMIFRGDSHLLAEDEECSVFSVQFWKSFGRRVALRWFFRRFAGFLAVGKANAEYFRAHGVPEEKIVFCPHAVDNAFFIGGKNASFQFSVGSFQHERPRGLRAELGIPEDELVFLFAGKFEEKKQPLELLEAFRRAAVGRATLLFVGNGRLEQELKRKAEMLRTEILKGEVLGDDEEKVEPERQKTENSAKRIVFLPFQNQSRMPEVYRTGDVLLLPSRGRYETWGLAVNEAACCGLPAIVGSHVGCGPDLVQDGVTGWVFQAGSSEALQRALEGASVAHDGLAEMGRALKGRVLQRYSFERATEALLTVLDCKV
jgi:glycosyltransferase involved in cell wall biosynthesis